jgi:membrane protein DedA with SNARE-associated domain
MARDQLMTIDVQNFLVGGGRWALAPIFLVITMESTAFLGLLLPGEMVALIAGALSAKGIFSPWLAFGTVAGGAIFGDIVGYALGHHLGRSALIKCQILWRQYDRHHRQFESYFHRWGIATVLIGRFIAAGRVFVPFMAGLSRMEASRFIPMAIVSGSVWGALVVALGYALGSRWRVARRGLGAAGAVILIIFLVTMQVIWRYRRRCTTLGTV